MNVQRKARPHGNINVMDSTNYIGKKKTNKWVNVNDFNFVNVLEFLLKLNRLEYFRTPLDGFFKMCSQSLFCSKCKTGSLTFHIRGLAEILVLKSCTPISLCIILSLNQTALLSARRGN